jgi:hypothetical protein
MILETVIAQLKARVPLLGARVAGAANFSVLPESANLVVPAAYVIPLADQPSEQLSKNGYQQACRDEIAVVVVLSNRNDERGQTAAGSLQALRVEIFKALLGWQPAANYDAMQFEGGQLLHLDRARMYYQLEFSAGWEIATEDTWIVARDNELPPFEGVNLRVDLIDPSDPNRAKPGPDGTVDAGANLDLPQES